MDLYFDAKILILDRLDLGDLITMADTNHHFCSLAEDEFRLKFAKKVIKIIDSRAVVPAEITKSDIIEINDFLLAMKMLKHFGHLISRLSIAHSKFDENSKRLYQFINLYCAKTLITIEIDMKHIYHNDYFFSDMKSPFVRVQSVSLAGSFGRMGSSNLRLNQLFPVMNQLTLKFTSFLVDGLNQNYLNVKHLHIELCKTHDPVRFSESEAMLILEKNRQIESLTLAYFSRKFLRVVNEILPNLKELKLMHYNPSFTTLDDGQEVHMKKVKSLTIDAAVDGMPFNVTFENLEAFHLNAFPGEKYRWIDFIEKNTQIKKLYVDRGSINNSELNRIIASNLELSEISLTIDTDVTQQTIVNFIRKNEQMNKIHIRMEENPETLKSAMDFLEVIYQNWTFMKSDYEYLVINNMK